MKKRNIILLLIALALSSSLIANKVWADSASDSEKITTDDYEIEAEAESESECEVEGPYGQCSTSADAEVKIKITKLDKDTVVYHKPADTALDVKTTMAASGTILTGLVAFMLKLKSRFA